MNQIDSPVEHAIWKPKIAGGIQGQRIAIVGYSHYHAECETDRPDLTCEVLSAVAAGAKKHNFFTKIREWFGRDNDDDFWNRVYFFNFLPYAIGPSDRKHQSGSRDQVERGRERFMRFLREERPEKAFVFTTKGWKSFPELTSRNWPGQLVSF